MGKANYSGYSLYPCLEYCGLSNTYILVHQIKIVQVISWLKEGKVGGLGSMYHILAFVPTVIVC